MMAAIAMTVATPMTTPRIVSDERSLLARSVASAMPTFSPSCSSRRAGDIASLRPHRGNRIEPRGAGGGVDAEEHPDAGPEGLADADLVGALGHRHQHDVHDHDAADHDADRHHGRDHAEQHARERLP